MRGHRKIVLASSSPYRRQLLQQIGLTFETDSPEIDETPRPGESPTTLVRRLAKEKAAAVARRHPHALLIGSDQVADHQGTIVGKPADHAEAVEQLRQASGREITLYTGIALLDAASGRSQVDVLPFSVVFRDLDDDLIERYLRAEQPYNCCGSLRAEGAGISLLKALRGDDPNALIGLPLIRLCEMLAVEGVFLF